MLVYGFFISLPSSRCSRLVLSGNWTSWLFLIEQAELVVLSMFPPLQEKEYKCPFICEITFAASAKVNLENGKREGSGPRKLRQYIILLLLIELLATLVYDN